MLFVSAHVLGFYYFSSFRKDRSALRLIPELVLYVFAVALVFSPVLDGNNYLYALTIILFHLITAPVVFFVTKKAEKERTGSLVFVITELAGLAGYAAMAFFYSVRWGSFEPWRPVRFFLAEAGLNFNQVLSWVFAALVLIRPVNILIRKLNVFAAEGETEHRHVSGAFTGVVERLLYFGLCIAGSWFGFALVFFGKCALFCLAVRKDELWGLRLYTGSLISALFVVPAGLIARAFF